MGAAAAAEIEMQNTFLRTLFFFVVVLSKEHKPVNMCNPVFCRRWFVIVFNLIKELRNKISLVIRHSRCKGTRYLSHVDARIRDVSEDQRHLRMFAIHHVSDA